MRSRALPESSRNSLDNGYFAPAAADGSRPGILWVNIYATGVRDKFNVMTISLHEGLPGHHLQTSVAQERTDLPSFRRFDSTNAYVEGWGLYAETLGRDPGQALSYKIGEMKILELRERVQRKLGARFDIRSFHDQILLGGSMPMAILERKVDGWAAQPR